VSDPGRGLLNGLKGLAMYLLDARSIIGRKSCGPDATYDVIRRKSGNRREPCEI